MCFWNKNIVFLNPLYRALARSDFWLGHSMFDMVTWIVANKPPAKTRRKQAEKLFPVDLRVLVWITASGGGNGGRDGRQPLSLIEIWLRSRYIGTVVLFPYPSYRPRRDSRRISAHFPTRYVYRHDERTLCLIRPSKTNYFQRF